MAISLRQRQKLSQRANQQCEYCLLHEEHTANKHEPDHIIPQKHGGVDTDNNLAWACFHCNRFKGSEVAAFDQQTGELTWLFNLRQDSWREHFLVENGFIWPQTAVGRVTALVLQLNRPARVQVRAMLAQAELYP